MLTQTHQRIEQFEDAHSIKAPMWAAPQQFPQKLVGMEQGNVVDIVRLKPEPFHVIGRHAQLTHVCIPGDSISRRHAVLVHNGERNEVHIADINSTNGTFINKILIEPLELYKISISFSFLYFW